MVIVVVLITKHAKDIKVHKFNGPVKNDGKISVLVLGLDKASGGKSRSDSIMVVQYDYIHKKMKMMSVMRDIYAEIPGYQIIKLMRPIHLADLNFLERL